MIEMSDAIIENALNSLGKGFDLTSDFRLQFCKGNDRLVLLNKSDTKELNIPGYGTFKDMVSVDIKCDKGERTRYQSDILDFNKMSEFFNQKSSLPGKIPSGLFNAMFGFNSSSWITEAANTKYLGLDGYSIILFNLHIDRYPLVLSDEVRNAVPSSWDPSALARFIESYGTHIIVGLSIGGYDVILLRQDKSSYIGPSELKKHLEDLGDQLFTGACSLTPQHNKAKGHQKKAPEAFNFFDPQHASFNSLSSVKVKDGITVTCSKRGGDLLSANSHCEWLLTVPSKPDAIRFSFIPITSLLKDVPGKGLLSHAINLYLRYKPPIADLEYFLEYQGHKLWAPIHSDFPLGPATNKGFATPILHFNLMGPKMFVNTTQVIVKKRPVTGMRLYLEGRKENRLAIHLQHLSTTPIMLQTKIDHSPPIWRGSDEINNNESFFEPIKSKQFSHICTAPVKHDPQWISSDTKTVFIVTGAQLHTTKHNGKNVLQLRLLFSKISKCSIIRSSWAQSGFENSRKSGFFSGMSMTMNKSNYNYGGNEKGKAAVVVVDSGVFTSGPPRKGQREKLMKFVDTAELCRGPQDNPGHWLVTGAKLELEKGKICIQVKFSLLNIHS